MLHDFQVIFDFLNTETKSTFITNIGGWVIVASPWLLGGLIYLVFYYLPHRIKPKKKIVIENEVERPAGTQFTNEERNELIQHAESFIRALGEYTDNPVADMLYEKIDLLKEGATKEQIAEFEKRYNSIYGWADDSKSNP
jgi:hypothetical protein